MSFRLEIPGLAYTLNVFKAAKNWRVASRMRDEYRSMYWAEIKAAKLPKMGAIGLTITQYTKRARDVDSGTMAAKWFLDALTDAKCLEDDSPQYVRYLTLKSEKTTGAEKTVFDIEVLEA